jgi:hypothetical protein
MVYLAGFHWVWLIASLLLGLAMGWIAVVHRGRGVSKSAARWLSVLVLALIVAAFMHVVPGRFGYWLDLGLVMLGIYLIGCAVGSWLRDGVVSRQAASGGSTEHSGRTLQ